ncbi:2'-5' RNA ligase family protein [Flavobacterium sp. MFBS3-15]|uniref:2'-5' RNA ligase family protein n=1 Tax=Flavobacterium sp. MFBS3-15 TaxID=2989816 RepID=UPI0022361C32|nr:2'-5' RNA ligase family protein [Flavobacterium sp. MFBS3-15]MCW4467655.1 2'-5' RNA ligase family protein [Flavobacterium sp. MFBS3-15]
MCAKKRIYNQESLFGPLYAYLVVISPPDEVKADVARLKKELDQVAGIGERNLHSIAHITLTEKLTDDEAFPQAVSHLLGKCHPFPVTIDGWGHFDHGHSVTVYLTVADPEPITEMAGLLRSNAKSPHIALAKKISHDTFQKLLPFLDGMDYRAAWTCSGIVVLGKLMSEKHLGFNRPYPISFDAPDDELKI